MRKILFLLIVTACVGLRADEVRRVYSLESGWRAVCVPEDTVRYGSRIVADDVSLPHNFDDYYGARQRLHGNLHGTATYDIAFRIMPPHCPYDVYHRLRIEGAGSYVTVVLDGDTLCQRRPAGRVVTTLPLPKALSFTEEHHLRIICHHPSRITDMPWVCGGCSTEWGFSEGSAPLGLFRGVSIEELSGLHVQPFGVYVRNNAACDTLFVETEVENLAEPGAHRLQLETTLATFVGGNVIGQQSQKIDIKRGRSGIVRQAIPIDSAVVHWSPKNPVLYQVRTRLSCYDVELGERRVCDELTTEYGFRNIEWGRQFKIDGKPVFLNGICEYEHAFGHSHALAEKEIDHRCILVKTLGYNAFRDAHQPHNLRYQRNWNRLGIVCWVQFSAHIWYDTPAFRENFKTLLRQWVKERRNEPSVVLWGLQNESTLPTDFAAECTAIIKELDPNSGRLVTTCNGGTGTDWNVVQNWSGTYGGKLENYATELKQDNQLLNGEYGAWRTIGLHDTLTVFNPKAPHSEEKFSMLLKSKMLQAWSVRDSVCGQYLWLMYSHDNPGRYQPDEALRLIDKVGPFNYKGLFTNWGQPTAFARTLLRDSIGQTVDNDSSALLLRGIPDMTYLYRYNCGGDSVIDTWGQLWMGDDTRFSHSWAQRESFAADSLCPVLASQGVADSPVSVAFPTGLPQLLPLADQAIARTFRWGRHELKFRFPVEPQRPYNVEIYAIEPWLAMTDARLFDIAVNGMTLAKNIDVAAVSQGRNRLVRTTLNASSGDRDYLEISFPRVECGQAVVCAIAISTPSAVAEGMSLPAIGQEKGYPYSAGLTWAALDTMTLAVTPKGYFPTYDANQNQETRAQAEVAADGTVRFGFSTGLAHEYVLRFRYKNVTGDAVGSRWELRSNADNRVIAQGTLAFPVTPAKWKPVSTTTGSMINAGSYTLVLKTDVPLEFDYLTVE